MASLGNNRPDFFTALPVVGHASSVLRAYQSQFVKSVCSLINSAATGLREDPSELVGMYSRLDDSVRFSPRLHYLHHKLQKGLRENDSLSVRESLGKLGCMPLAEIYAPELAISTSVIEDWETYIVSEAHKSTARDGRGRLPKISNEPISSFEKMASTIKNVIGLIETCDSVMAEQVNNYVSHIKLFEGEGIVGMTDVRMFGAIFLRVPDENLDPTAYFSEHLIHETSHLHLNALMVHDPLVLNGPEELYPAPIRLDPRPMYGIFHATFVLSRIVRFFKFLTKQFPANEAFSESLTITERQLRKGVSVVSSFAKCTELGNKVVASFLPTSNSLCT